MDRSQINVKLISVSLTFVLFVSFSLNLYHFPSELYPNFMVHSRDASHLSIVCVCLCACRISPCHLFSTPKWIFIWVDLWLMPNDHTYIKYTRFIWKLYVSLLDILTLNTDTQSNALKSVWRKESGFRYFLLIFFSSRLLFRLHVI